MSPRSRRPAPKGYRHRFDRPAEAGAAAARSEPTWPRASVDEQDRGASVANKRPPGLTNAVLPPARRDAHDEKGRRVDRFHERLLGRLREERLGLDTDDPLHRQRRVCQQAAGVTATAW